MNTQPLLTLAQAQSIITDERMMAFLTPLVDTIKWWREDMKESHLRLGPLARAININEQWWSRAKEAYSETPGFNFIVERNQRLLIIDEVAMLRFKLLDEELESNNYPTAQALELIRQQYHS